MLPLAVRIMERALLTCQPDRIWTLGAATVQGVHTRTKNVTKRTIHHLNRTPRSTKTSTGKPALNADGRFWLCAGETTRRFIATHLRPERMTKKRNVRLSRSPSVCSEGRTATKTALKWR